MVRAKFLMKPETDSNWYPHTRWARLLGRSINIIQRTYLGPSMKIWPGYEVSSLSAQVGHRRPFQLR